MTNCRNLTAILIFIVLALKGQAQFVNSYTVENSPLPFNTVRCLEYSNQTLWIGTDYGLAKLENETNWTIYNSMNSPLWNDNIRALKNDGDSLIWIGTIQGGLFKFDGSEWVNYTPENSGIGDFLVRGIEIDLNGHIWVATTEGLYMFDRNSWNSWSSDDGLLSNNISTICADSNTKYIGTINGGVLYFDALNNFTNHTIISSGIPDNSALDIEIDLEGRPWFISPAAGLVVDMGNGGPWNSFNALNSDMPANSLLCLTHGEQGEIYIGSESNGLITKIENVYLQLNTENSNLTDNHILSIVKGNSQDLWVGTFNGGICKIETNQTNHLFEQSDFQVTPNIIKRGQRVNFSQNIKAQYEIYTLQGKIIQSGHLKNQNYLEISVPVESSCVFLKINQNGFFSLEKIIIN